jgi:hypothetical protein
MSKSAFSLVDGGPLCRLIRRAGWVRPEGHCDYLRVSIALVSLAWGPLLVLAVVEWLTTGHTPSIDWGVHARLLVSVPLLFKAEASLHRRTQRTIEIFTSERWAPDQPDRCARIFATAGKLRDAVAPELILLCLALIGSQAVVWRLGGMETVMRELTRDTQLVAPKYWYALVALPVFQFLVYRMFWRWGIWTYLLWRLSRLQLQPIATHPDLAGGLGFLSMPSVGFAYVIAGLSAAQAGVWANQVIVADVPIDSFKWNLLAFTVGAVVLAFGPLAAFAGHLWRCRFAGHVQYGDLATDYARLFHARWIEQRQRTDLLGNPDIQSLADLANSFNVVDRTRLFPFHPLLVALIVAAAVLPAIPVAMLRVPLTELLMKLGGAVLGKGPG